jgi:large subunit ribosomal protein L15
VRLSELEGMKAGDIDLAVLKAQGIVPKETRTAKVILSGKLTRSVTLKGVKVSKGARAAIEAAGGKIEDAVPAAQPTEGA